MEKPLSTRTPAIISAALTVILLILLSVLFLFVQMVALNGASERQGVTAMGLSLVCQGVGVILAAVLASWLTNLVIAKFNWNKILAILVAVLAATLLGGLISFFSVIIAISLAGIR